MPFDSSTDPFSAGTNMPKSPVPDAKTFDDDDDLADAGKGATSSTAGGAAAAGATKEFDEQLDDPATSVSPKGGVDDDLLDAGTGAKANVALGLDDVDDLDVDDLGKGALDDEGSLFDAGDDDVFATDKAIGSIGADGADDLEPGFKGFGDDLDGPDGAHGNADFDDDDAVDKGDIDGLF